MKYFLVNYFLLFTLQVNVLAQKPNTGQVVYITDGDTFTMKIGNDKVKIRMADIDAPEMTQHKGLECKEHLMSLIKDQVVEIKIRDKDHYGRTIAFVYSNGIDINKTMIADGYAWWYEKYGPENTDYKEAQEKAKEEKLGMWAYEFEQIPPWDWRQQPGPPGSGK